MIDGYESAAGKAPPAVPVPVRPTIGPTTTRPSPHHPSASVRYWHRLIWPMRIRYSRPEGEARAKNAERTRETRGGIGRTVVSYVMPICAPQNAKKDLTRYKEYKYRPRVYGFIVATEKKITKILRYIKREREREMSPKNDLTCSPYKANSFQIFQW